MKKILMVFLSICIITSSVASAQYSVSDAYKDFKSEQGKFVESITSRGVDESTVMSFVEDLYKYIMEINSNSKITEEKFDKVALLALSRVSSRENYASLKKALYEAYPDSMKMALKEAAISEEFEGIIQTIKRIVFDNNMLEIKNGDAGDNPTLVSPFSDISVSHWAFDAICTLSEKFILNGYLDGTFKPDANITRAEFAKIIVSATDTLDVFAASSFSDVSSDSWYYSYVSSAQKKGYITGYPDGTFHPDDNITRADICTIIQRCLGKTNYSSDFTFSDDRLIPSYAREAVYSLVSAKAVNGMGDGSFNPLSYATRAQTSKILYQALFINNK